MIFFSFFFRRVLIGRIAEFSGKIDYGGGGGGGVFFFISGFHFGRDFSKRPSSAPLKDCAFGRPRSDRNSTRNRERLFRIPPAMRTYRYRNRKIVGRSFLHRNSLKSLLSRPRRRFERPRQLFGPRNNWK